MPSTKCEGLSYPTHFLKSKGSVIKDNFHEYRNKQATLSALRNDFMHCSLQIKQNNLFNRHFSCSCCDTILSKSIKKNQRTSHFRKFIISLLVNIFRM